jgi:hypothetical protein
MIKCIHGYNINCLLDVKHIVHKNLSGTYSTGTGTMLSPIYISCYLFFFYNLLNDQYIIPTINENIPNTTKC